MKTYFSILLVICCLMCFVGGRCSVGRARDIINTDTVRVVRVDTFMTEKIVPKHVYHERVIKDTLLSLDTVLVEVYVPIDKYVFTDSLYRAEVSGYKVSLDKIEIYRKTVSQTVNVPVIKRDVRRFGLGVSVGYAYTYHGFQPYVGVGLQYNVISF